MPALRWFLPLPPETLASPRKPFIHRDISALQFIERVLGEARSSKNPLLERLKFLSISASIMDEFFMIRFASLGRSIRNLSPKAGAEARHLIRVRNLILHRAAGLTTVQAETLDLLLDALKPHGVHLVRPTGSMDAPHEESRRIFETTLFPELPSPAPFQPKKIHEMENLGLAAIFPSGQWIQIPRTLPNILPLPAGPDGVVRWALLDDILLQHLRMADRRSTPPALIRLTRDGDGPVPEGGDDPASIPDVVRSTLGSRERGRPVRLQYKGNAGAEFLHSLLSALRLSPRQVQSAPGTLCFQGLWSVLRLWPEKTRASQAIALPPLRPFLMQTLQFPDKIFDDLKERDLLLHHPYESFEGYINFIRAACADARVEKIQQTIYRIDAVSPIVEALKQAAPHKRIRVLIELRARFDESNNLKLADDLRNAGVEVAFGFGQLKLHAKIATVSRREGSEVVLYTHLSTGNYNADTARAYEDMAILTADPDLGKDAEEFFDAVFSRRLPTSLRALIPAPAMLHRRIIRLIKAESKAAQRGRPAYLFAKVNALVDPRLIENLYEASQAGVRVDLLVRGACSLIPGVKGLSENIRVFSLVDRFLEHSRIYFFSATNQIYLSSADWMPRNFFSRMEIAFPVKDPRLFLYVRDVVIPIYLNDTAQGRELTPQGTWRRRSPNDTTGRPTVTGLALPIRAQFAFEELAKRGYQGTPLARAEAERVSTAERAKGFTGK